MPIKIYNDYKKTIWEITFMKAGRFGVNLVGWYTKKLIKKRRKEYPPHEFEEFLNIPYIDDANLNHSYDVYKAKENRKNCCIIDIHGGSYIFGEHGDNYPLAYVFLKEGYDVVLVDYVPNNGKLDTLDLIKDISLNFAHLSAHLKDYGLEKDEFVITGDSAGGHFALLFAEMNEDEKIKEELGLSHPKLDVKSVLLNCPVYDFEFLGEGALTKSGKIRMLGPKSLDPLHLRKLSPRTYIRNFHLPIFLSTCKFDFIRGESLKLMKDIKNRENIKIIDIQSENKKVDHVHNVTKIKLEESKKVNSEMVDFIEKYL